jgi:hypothetical protein
MVKDWAERKEERRKRKTRAMCEARWDLEGIHVFEGCKIFRLETLVEKFGSIMF